jgi:non-ribosomal peptide synthetase component F
MTTLAAFGVLLHFYTGQEDLLVASPAANRTRLGTEGVLGLFANLLVLRVELAGDPSFREILERVRASTLAAFAHQDLPIEILVERLQPVRDAACSPLVQAHFSFENEPFPSWKGAGIAMTPVPLDHGTSPYELDLNLVAADEGLSGEIVFCPDLFDAGTIARAAEHYATVLRAVAAAPELRLPDLSRALEQAERTEREHAARHLGEASRQSLRRLARREASPLVEALEAPQP